MNLGLAEFNTQQTPQQVPFMNDDIKGFNHNYNVQFQVMQCLMHTNNPIEYINSVNMLEVVLMADPDNRLLKKIEEEEKALIDKLGVQFETAGNQYVWAKTKFRLFYAYAKTRRTRVVLAIGRPKCLKCGELIAWNREDHIKYKKERDERLKEAKQDG